MKVAIIIPAHNEVAFIGNTLDSVLGQTFTPSQIIVVDDFSTDGTGEYIRSRYPMVTVIRPDKNLGSKALAQNFALFYKAGNRYLIKVIDNLSTDDTRESIYTRYPLLTVIQPDKNLASKNFTSFCKVENRFLIKADMIVTIDADTSLDRDALEKLTAPMINNQVLKATCGTVIPKNLDNIFTLGRLGEYLYSFFFPKRIQQLYGGNIHIISGCFGCYNTQALRARSGWHSTTMAEDMDLTADYHEKGYKVAYVHDAICRPVEPFNWITYKNQMQRWSAAYFQNVALHFWTYLRKPVGIFVLVSFLDASISGVIYPLTPVWVYVFGWQKWLFWFIVGDFSLISIPILLMGSKLKLLKKAFLSVPFVFFLRLLNIGFWFRALFREWIIRKPLKIYIKGH